MKKSKIKNLRKNICVVLSIIFFLHIMLGYTKMNIGSIDLKTYQVTERKNRGNTMKGGSPAIPLLQRERQVYDAHDPISIDGDEGFKAYSFPGTGTKDDPYRIEGLNITTTQRAAIYITNTTVHFVIAHSNIAFYKLVLAISQ